MTTTQSTHFATSKEKVDVAILGAGVSGTSCALLLKKAGFKVRLIEKSTSGQVPEDNGETLPPKTIQALGKFLSIEDLTVIGEKYDAMRVIWGNDSPQTRPFMASVPSHGLRINKSDLVALLRDQVTPEVLSTGCTIYDPDFNRQGLTSIHIRAIDGTRKKLEARYFIDATGRNRALTRQTTEIIRFDNLVATSTTNTSDNLQSTLPIIESFESGWWYSSRVKSKRVLTRFSDSTDMSMNQLQADFLSTLHLHKTTSSPIGNIRRTSASSTLLKQIVCQNIIAIGDAARTVDPLSSQGILNAVEDASALTNALIHDQGTSQFESSIQATYEEYMEQRSAIYSRELRWPHSPFWLLRQP